MTDELEVFDMGKARELWRSKHDTTKTARKARHKKLVGSVDRRSLRATGRTEQFNFRSRKGLKARAQEAAEAAGLTLAEWMERAVEAALARRKIGGPDGDA